MLLSVWIIPRIKKQLLLISKKTCLNIRDTRIYWDWKASEPKSVRFLNGVRSEFTFSAGRAVRTGPYQLLEGCLDAASINKGSINHDMKQDSH